MSSAERPLGELPANLGGSNDRALVFLIAGRGFALPANYVQEVLPFAQLEEPPGLPRGLAGFLRIAGNWLPVLRLATLFDLPESPAGLYTPLIELRGLEPPFAIWVDGVQKIVPASRELIDDLPRGYASHPAVAGWLTTDDSQVLLLDANQLAQLVETLQKASPAGSAPLPQEALP
jgi:chemotaxis signal transduction protein